jgi:hypothetical protein
MAIRMHEVHPAVVHFPLTLLPLAIGVDFAARLTGRRAWRTAGRVAMPMAAVGATVAAIAGLIAQEEVTAPGRARELLTTHRTLNLAATGVTAALAMWRAVQRRPERRVSLSRRRARRRQGRRARDTGHGEGRIGARHRDRRSAGAWTGCPSSSVTCVARRVRRRLSRGTGVTVECG